MIKAKTFYCIITIIIYYSLLYISLSKNKKYIIFLLLLIIIIKNINKLDMNYYIYFMSVGQGDMSLIKYKDNSILIDTGPKNFYTNYEITDNNIKFFQSIGINKIDSLIITHGDLDHIGNAKYLIENFFTHKYLKSNNSINILIVSVFY